MNPSDAVLKHIDAHLAGSIDRLFELIRFPSVGTDPRFDTDCRNAAAWLVKEFEGLGFATAPRGLPAAHRNGHKTGYGVYGTTCPGAHIFR